MDYFIKTIVSLLKEKTNLPEDEIARLLEIPPDFKMGDYAFPCYSLAKTLKSPPNTIAAELSKTLHTIINENPPESPLSKGGLREITEIKAIGPYVNFFVNKVMFSEMVLKKINEEQDYYGSGNTGRVRPLSLIILPQTSPSTLPFTTSVQRSSEVRFTIFTKPSGTDVLVSITSVIGGHNSGS